MLESIRFNAELLLNECRQCRHHLLDQIAGAESPVPGYSSRGFPACWHKWTCGPILQSCLWLSSHALLILTEWSVFRTPDFDRLEQLLKAKVIFDGRNLYDLQKMIDCGYYYNSIGRKVIS